MKTISEIKEEFAGLDIIKYQEFRNRYPVSYTHLTLPTILTV